MAGLRSLCRSIAVPDGSGSCFLARRHRRAHVAFQQLEHRGLSTDPTPPMVDISRRAVASSCLRRKSTATLRCPLEAQVDRNGRPSTSSDQVRCTAWSLTQTTAISLSISPMIRRLTAVLTWSSCQQLVRRVEHASPHPSAQIRSRIYHVTIGRAAPLLFRRLDLKTFAGLVTGSAVCRARDPGHPTSTGVWCGRTKYRTSGACRFNKLSSNGGLPLPQLLHVPAAIQHHVGQHWCQYRAQSRVPGRRD